MSILMPVDLPDPDGGPRPWIHAVTLGAIFRFALPWNLMVDFGVCESSFVDSCGSHFRTELGHAWVGGLPCCWTGIPRGRPLEGLKASINPLNLPWYVCVCV